VTPPEAAAAQTARPRGPAGLWVAEHRPAAAGPAPLVLLVHGAMDRAAGMARVVGHLRDLHVVRYDRRGYGRSWQAGAPDFAGHVDDLLAVLDGRPGVVIGHSFGGSLALAAAGRRPDLVLAVGAYESPLAYPSAAPVTGEDVAATGPGLAEAFLRRMIGDEAWEALPPGIQEARRREGPAFRAEGLALRAVPAAFDPGALTVPVVAGMGSESAPRYQGFAEALVAVAGADLLVIEGAGHGAHLSHPALFAEFVRQVVRRAGLWPVG
jgi:pimeloyl-ACP methyl ester carboxylesterase